MREELASAQQAGSDYGRFTKALSAGHLTEALMYAADIRVVALPEVQLAAAALGWLWEYPESEVPLATLSALLRN